MQLDLLPEEESVLKSNYEKAILIQTLKEGKPWKRKSLIKNIFYLSGLYHFYREVQATMSDDPNFNRLANVRLGSNYRRTELLKDNEPTPEIKITPRELVTNSVFLDCLKKYMGETKFFYIPCSNWLKIYYNVENVKWYLIDYDLKLKFPDNITIDHKTKFVRITNYFR